MKRLCIITLIIGQALALTAWASVPVISEQGTESAHMQLDDHDHGSTEHQHSSDDHEHDEGCHLHLSVQLNDSGSLNIASEHSKSIQNSHLSIFHSRALTGPPTPPPTA